MGMIHPTESQACFIGLDVGGTKMLGIAIDEQGQVLARVHTLTSSSGDAALGDEVLTILREVITRAGAVQQQPRGIAICAPGHVDSQTGVITNATNLGVRRLALGEIVQAAFGLPTLIVHDVKAAALGEAYFGAGKAARHSAFLNLGTGIAIGLILDGSIYNGASGRAGELGHVCMVRHGPLCPCGRRGCLEALAAGPALARDARIAIQAGRTSLIATLVNGEFAHIDAAIIARAANLHDSLALELITTSAGYIGQAIANLINVLDLQCVIIGGGMAQMGPMLFERIEQAVAEHLLDEYQGTVQILPSMLGANAGALGAVAAFTKHGL